MVGPCSFKLSVKVSLYCCSQKHVFLTLLLFLFAIYSGDHSKYHRHEKRSSTIYHFSKNDPPCSNFQILEIFAQIFESCIIQYSNNLFSKNHSPKNHSFRIVESRYFRLRDCRNVNCRAF